MSQNPNRDIDLLKVNLASNYRLGWLVAWIGVYFTLIIGLLVAWYQKYGTNTDIFYYSGIALIVGVLGSLLATQELLPYKNWLKQVDEWLRTIESNQRIPEVTKLVRLRDSRKSTGHAILIFLVVLDFYLILLGYPPLQLFLGFLAAGVIVLFLVEGGIGWIKKLRWV